MKKLILALMIIIVSCNVLAIDCTSLLLEKYPRMQEAKAEKSCNLALSSININDISEIKVKDKLIFLEEPLKDELLKLKYQDLRKLFHIKDISKINELDYTIISKFSKLSRAEIVNVLDNKDIDINELLANKDTFRNNALVKRGISKDTIEKSRINYLVAEQSFIDGEKDYYENRAKFDENKEKISSCSIDCEAIENNLVFYSRNYISNAQKMIVSVLSKNKAKIESNENLEIEESEEIIDEINEHLKKLSEINTEIENADSKVKVKKAGKTLSEVWKIINPVIRRSSGTIIKSRIGEIIIKAQRLENRLNLVLTILEYKGIELDIDSLLNDFSLNVFDAQKYYEMSTKKLTKSRYSYESKELLDEANIDILKANSHMKNAQQILSNILIRLNKNNNAIAELDKSFEELEITVTAYEAIQQ